MARTARLFNSELRPTSLSPTTIMSIINLVAAPVSCDWCTHACSSHFPSCPCKSSSWYANENAGLAAKLQDKGVHLALFFNAADTERSARARAYYTTTARMQTWSHGAYAHKVRVSDESTGWLGRTFGRVFNAFSLLAATNAFTALASLLGAPPRSSLRSRESTRTPLRRSG